MKYAIWETTPQDTTAGDDVLWAFQVRDGDGAVVDITGWTFGFYATEQEDSTNTLAITNASFTITDAATGRARFAIASATTLSLGNTTFYAELWRIDSGNKKKLCSGTWRVSGTVRP